MKSLRQLNSVELCGFAVGLLFILAGLATVIHPQFVTVLHATNDAMGGSGNAFEAVSVNGARIYGALALLFGAGFVTASMWRDQR
jgi:hypothetical protein